MQRNDEFTWHRLLKLLAPIHTQAAVTARRLSRNPDDGDDLFQEALLRAFAKLHTLRDEARFRAWFYAVLLSVHRNRSRHHFWRRFLSLDAARARGFDPPGADARDLHEERLGAARASRALASLPSVQREAVVLFELDGLSIEEIADLQDVTISAVKSRLARGRERLRRHYQKVHRHEGSTSPGIGASPAAAEPAPAGRRS
jgi:RNA polymerase sigma-70 factor (ECF subfamily)